MFREELFKQVRLIYFSATIQLKVKFIKYYDHVINIVHFVVHFATHKIYLIFYTFSPFPYYNRGGVLDNSFLQFPRSLK